MPDYLFTPLTAVSLLATAISLTIAAMLWRRRTAPGALALTVLELAAAVWSFAFAFDAAATSSQLKLFWSQIEYPGITVAPLAFHIFAFQFSQKGGHISWRRIAWLAVVPGLTIVLAWTNFGHGLVWRGVVIDPTTNLGIYDHGPWFWLFAA
ncbi:MAG: hypothetical protein GY722_06420, partial [bacterium]|nr:hypothetical protein [bacterium]